MTTHIHNPTYPCSCHIGHAGPDEHIVYCPMHAAAPDLLAALQACLCYLEPDADDSQEQQDYAQARLAINKAQSL